MKVFLEDLHVPSWFALTRVFSFARSCRRSPPKAARQLGLSVYVSYDCYV
jgi:hypothetical protein